MNKIKPLLILALIISLANCGKSSNNTQDDVIIDTPQLENEVDFKKSEANL